MSMDDDRLEDMMKTAAESYTVPDDGPARVMAAARSAPLVAEAKPSRWPVPPIGRWGLAAAAVVALVVGVVVAGRLSSSPRKNTTAAASTTAAGAARSAAPQPAAAPAPVPAQTGVPAPAAPGGAASAPGQFAPAAGAGSASDTARPARAVVMGNLQLVVGSDRITATLDQLEQVARDAGGFTADRTATGVVLRLPNATYDNALAQAKQLGSVRNVRTDSQDVSQAYDELSRGIAELEQKGGSPDELDRLRQARARLEDTIAFATLTVSVTSS